MPDRFVRDGLLTSARFNDLPVQTQNFFVRLILVCDDFGCFDGRDGVCASKCYPLAPPAIEEITAMLAALHAAGLIIRYSNAGKAFIAIKQWRQNLRGRRKFPAPPIDVDLPGAGMKGKWSSPIGWQNPAGYDDVSVLLDSKSRPVNPQPDEWRPNSHFTAPDQHDVGQDVRQEANRTAPKLVSRTSSPTSRPTHSRSSSATTVALPSESDVMSAQVVGRSSQVEGRGDGGAGGDVGRSVGQDVPSPPSPPNGTRWNGEAIETSEALRLRWQALFEALAVPDEIDRASEWLRTHDGERAAILDQHGLEAYLFRWLQKSHNAKTARG